MDFKTSLKEEMEYRGIQHKKLAAKADIKPRALLTYIFTLEIPKQVRDD